MSYRPDEPAFNRPILLTESPLVTESTATAPTVDDEGNPLEVGELWVHEDTGARFYWSGSEWLSVSREQMEALKLDLLFEIRDYLRLQTDEEEEV